LKLLGLMSGTSLDGIDVALLEVEEEAGSSGEAPPRLSGWTVLDFHTRPYAPEERERIRAAIQAGGPEDLALLHTALGRWFA